MGQLVPNPVSVATLGNAAAGINQINDGSTPQADQPRFYYTDWVTVEVTDQAGIFYTQKHYKGEWLRGGMKDGQADDATVPQVILPTGES